MTTRHPTQTPCGKWKDYWFCGQRSKVKGIAEPLVTYVGRMAEPTPPHVHQWLASVKQSYWFWDEKVRSQGRKSIAWVQFLVTVEGKTWVPYRVLLLVLEGRCLIGVSKSDVQVMGEVGSKNISWEVCVRWTAGLVYRSSLCIERLLSAWDQG